LWLWVVGWPCWLRSVPAPGPGSCRSAWTQTGHVLERYEGRIADLEDRLADTDEGMSQNAAVQAAKIRELDSEVRKLWDNVWKRSKERLGVLEASSKRFASQRSPPTSRPSPPPSSNWARPGRISRRCSASVETSSAS
jgi:uncharacterized coiled-coil protein SlyX